MTIPAERIYPRSGDTQTIYLKNGITDPGIEVGDYTIYNDFVNDPRDFQKNNVLYHYPINHDRLVIGKFCSIACGAKFLFTSANHTLRSLSTYTFPIFFEEWGLDKKCVANACFHLPVTLVHNACCFRTNACRRIRTKNKNSCQIIQYHIYYLHECPANLNGSTLSSCGCAGKMRQSGKTECHKGHP